MINYDKTTPEFWNNIQRGAFLDLCDMETITESMEDGQGVRGVEFEVISQPRRIEIEDVCEYILFDLQAKDKTDVLLVVLIADEDVEIKAYFEDTNILEPGDRNDIIEAGDFWVFEEPKDVNNFDMEELKFAKVIDFSETEYTMKRMGVMNGIYNNDSEMVASIAEYNLTGLAEGIESNNTEFMLLEYGHMDNPSGYIAAYFGYTINLSEIDVLQ